MLALFTLCLLALVSSNQTDLRDTKGLIEDLTLLDNPFDDGSGVILQWKPLPKEHRIIEYRIYRGVSPDTLFFLSNIEVDPALGVIGDQLTYYDSDYQVFFDLETAPARLTRERQQSPDSPLYGAVPRDPKILEEIIPHFTVLGAIKNKNYYYRSRKVIDPDGNISAGFRARHFENMYANPIDGNTYYYTVLAVNERGRLLPHAPIQSIVPLDNRPDSTSVIHTTLFKDTHEWNFEWTPPANSNDIYTWMAWLMPLTIVFLALVFIIQ